MRDLSIDTVETSAAAPSTPSHNASVLIRLSRDFIESIP